jgi:hypothetical protein
MFQFFCIYSPLDLWDDSDAGMLELAARFMSVLFLKIHHLALALGVPSGNIGPNPSARFLIGDLSIFCLKVSTWEIFPGSIQ